MTFGTIHSPLSTVQPSTEPLVLEVIDANEVFPADVLDNEPSPESNRQQPARRRWRRIPAVVLGFVWNLTSLVVLLAVVAAIPIVQLASLGYLLQAASNLSSGQAWTKALPGLRLAGRIATFLTWATLLWLPVFLMTDLSYSVQLLRPGTTVAAAWRAGAFLVAFSWVIWTAWAAMRGGRWWHFLWPAPWRFVTQFFRPSTWSRSADNLWALANKTHFVQLWWLGLQAAVGALLWCAVPVSLMIIGLRAHNLTAAGLVGFLGALSLTIVMLYLPMLQILLAEKKDFREIVNIREVRRRFRHAPWAFAMSLFLLFVACIPLYLLRIEATPDQLTWLPSLFFVGLIFPAKLFMGAALGYGARRLRPRHWTLRWSARTFLFLATLAYVGSLYIAQFVAWQGVFVMYFQHAVLVPVAS